MNAHQLGNHGLPEHFNALKWLIFIVIGFGTFAITLRLMFLYSEMLPGLEALAIMYGCITAWCFGDFSSRLECWVVQKYTTRKFEQCKQAFRELHANMPELAGEVIARVNENRRKIAEMVKAEERDLQFLELSLRGDRLLADLKAMPHYPPHYQGGSMNQNQRPLSEQYRKA